MLIRRVAELEEIAFEKYLRPTRATGVLMCPPRHFEIGPPLNVHMQEQKGEVDPVSSMAEWRALVAALEGLGIEVFELEPEPALIDLAFTANPSLLGVDLMGEPFAVLSRMRHASRAGEVGCHEKWLADRGIRRVRIPEEVTGCWEGGGDAIWHPGRYFLWAGFGSRSDHSVIDWLSRHLSLPVALLRLVDPCFYHLDTCLAMIDERTACWVPEAFDVEGRELLRAAFDQLIEVDVKESRERLACNLYCPDGKNVLLPSRSPRTRAVLEARGLHVQEIATDEFLKSGGSVYCLRQEVPAGV